MVFHQLLSNSHLSWDGISQVPQLTLFTEGRGTWLGWDGIEVWHLSQHVWSSFNRISSELEYWEIYVDWIPRQLAHWSALELQGWKNICCKGTNICCRGQIFDAKGQIFDTRLDKYLLQRDKLNNQLVPFPLGSNQFSSGFRWWRRRVWSIELSRLKYC